MYLKTLTGIAKLITIIFGFLSIIIAFVGTLQARFCLNVMLNPRQTQNQYGNLDPYQNRQVRDPYSYSAGGGRDTNLYPVGFDSLNDPYNSGGFDPYNNNNGIRDPYNKLPARHPRSNPYDSSKLFSEFDTQNGERNVEGCPFLIENGVNAAKEKFCLSIISIFFILSIVNLGFCSLLTFISHPVQYFDMIYHAFAGLLIFIGGILLIVAANDYDEITGKIIFPSYTAESNANVQSEMNFRVKISAGILIIFNGLFYLITAILVFRESKKVEPPISGAGDNLRNEIQYYNVSEPGSRSFGGDMARSQHSRHIRYSQPHVHPSGSRVSYQYAYPQWPQSQQELPPPPPLYHSFNQIHHQPGL